MNKQQFEIIASELIKSDTQRKAARLVVLHGKTAAHAERVFYCKITSTVARDVNRVNEMFDFCERVHEAGLSL